MNLFIYKQISSLLKNSCLSRIQNWVRHMFVLYYEQIFWYGVLMHWIQAQPYWYFVLGHIYKYIYIYIYIYVCMCVYTHFSFWDERLDIRLYFKQLLIGTRNKANFNPLDCISNSIRFKSINIFFFLKSPTDFLIEAQFSHKELH